MRKFSLTVLVIIYSIINQAQIGVGVIQLATTLDTNISNESSFLVRTKTTEGIELFSFETKKADSLFNAFIPKDIRINTANNIYIPCLSNNGLSWSVIYAGRDTIEILPREYRSPDLIFKPWEVFLLQCDSVKRTDPARNPVVGYPSPDGPIIRSLDSLTNFKVYDVFELDGHWWLRIYQGKQGEHVFGYHEDYMIEFGGKTFQNPKTFYNGFIQWRNKEELLVIPKPNYSVEYY